MRLKVKQEKSEMSETPAQMLKKPLRLLILSERVVHGVIDVEDICKRKGSTIICLHFADFYCAHKVSISFQSDFKFDCYSEHQLD